MKDHSVSKSSVKKKRRRTSMSQRIVEFDLTILETDGGGNYDIKAQLRSPLLDAKLHPEGQIDVAMISKGRVIQSVAGFVLDSFQIQSVLDYLRMQKKVRRTLERELAKDQKSWDPEGESVRGDVWAWAKLECLKINPRHIPNPQEFKKSKMRFSAYEIRQIMAASDTLETRSCFSVAISCDWDREHGREAVFRDGNFTELSN